MVLIKHVDQIIYYIIQQLLKINDYKRFLLYYLSPYGDFLTVQ